MGENRLFLVGIGGIGMSGLAQLLRYQGYDVYGSDRGLNEPGKAGLYEELRHQGIQLFPQDGSGIREVKPDMVIISTAVEATNPDRVAASELKVPEIHRARALAKALERERSRSDARLIAVAGSCGKTSVTGWIAAALAECGQTVLVVNGGYCLDATGAPGNFDVRGSGKIQWLVAEVDESDKSISEFSPDYGVLLNIGDDHYERAELQRVFGAFLQRCKRGAVIPQELTALGEQLLLPVRYFAAEQATEYKTTAEGMRFQYQGAEYHSSQCGRHSVSNAMAVLGLFSLVLPNLLLAQRQRALAAFHGVQQRFEVMGRDEQGRPCINDYAHNPEKIAASISTARERFGSPLCIAFQPHGFGPLKFIRQALKEHLATVLQPGDIFCFLPVFYAGGTASFSPTSEEVATEYAQAGLPVRYLQERQEFVSLIKSCQGMKAIVILGARDSSLRPWTASFACEK